VVVDPDHPPRTLREGRAEIDGEIRGHRGGRRSGMRRRTAVDPAADNAVLLATQALVRPSHRLVEQEGEHPAVHDPPVAVQLPPHPDGHDGHLPPSSRPPPP